MLNIKINFFTDVVVFWSKFFNNFYSKIVAKKKKTKVGDVKDMKARMQICLLEALKVRPYFES